MFDQYHFATVAVGVALFQFFGNSAVAVPVPKAFVSLGGYYTPERSAGDSPFGERSLNLKGEARLWSQAAPDPFSRHSSLSLLGRFARQEFTVQDESEVMTIYHARLGIGGVTLSRGGELLMIRLSGGFSEDKRLSGPPEWQVAGFGLGTYHTSEVSTLVLGGGYSYLFGRPLALPLIGARFQITDQWSLVGLAPFFVRFARSFSESADASFFVRAAGQRSRTLGQDTDFTTHLQLQRGQVGGAILKRFDGSGWAWSGQTGFEFLRRTALEGENFSGRPEPGFFVQLSVHKQFGGFDAPAGSRTELYQELDALLPIE